MSFFTRTRSALKARALRSRLQSYGFIAYSDVSDGTISAWGVHAVDADVDIIMSMPEATPLVEGHRVIDEEMLRLAVAIASWRDEDYEEED